MINKEIALKLIEALVLKFKQNEESYTSGGYNETQLRIEFLDPLFEALGWDIANKYGVAEQYKDVIHEDAVKVGEQTKAPDYSFRAGGVRKFFVEAKKPSISVKDDISPAYQVRRYAWSAKLPLAILTDFQEFAVYDCRQKPKPGDKASVSRISFYTYDQYLDKFEEIYGLFSKEAVLKGAFDKFATSDAKKKATTEVDKEFLKDIENWRELLAKNIALRNGKLSNDDLNFAVQTIIDRIIFLRICEDKALEPDENLKSILNSENHYKKLVNLFHAADSRYNAGLFGFEKDQITAKLIVDDKVLAEIIAHLYYPASPYVFSQMPIEILGQVYEQFLGKVIRLTEGHHAKVEEKPEVRKAGGVYYTPQYIVDYIVKNTVGELVKDKTPKEMESLKILDPACGSGSFLIGAYTYLLNCHLDWYLKNNPEKYIKAVFRDGKGEWRLTTQEAKKILLNNIFGVDIDSQAVEVTKLSLLLKVLENESKEAIEQQLKMFKERALPNIDSNIKCGNSLIGSEFYEDQLALGDNERKKVNVFDWDREFPEIIRLGGFDAVIGNPPYGANIRKEEREYLHKKYPEVADVETSQYFISRITVLLAENGYLHFIVPNTIFLNILAKKFRDKLFSTLSTIQILDLSDIEVFINATVRTVIPLFIKRKHNTSEVLLKKYNINKHIDYLINSIKQEELVSSSNIGTLLSSNKATVAVIKKVKIDTIEIQSLLETSQGLIPYDKYRGHDEKTIKNRIWHSDYRKDSTYKKELQGGDVKRYSVVWNGKQWISYGPWLAAPRKPEYFKEERLLFREITDPKTKQLNVAYTDEEYYNNPSIINCISRKDCSYSLLYILGIANSRLICFYHYSTSPKARKGIFPKILVDDVRRLPIHIIDFSNNEEKRQHNQMISLVEQIIGLKKKVFKTQNPHDIEIVERQIAATDKQIDKLVYGLYGLTEEEIKVVEGS